MLFSRHDVAHFAHQLYAQKLLSLQASELRLQLPIHVFRCRLIPAVALTQAEYFLSHHNVLECKRKERPEEMDLVVDVIVLSSQSTRDLLPCKLSKLSLLFLFS